MSVGVSELKWPAAMFVHVVCIPPYSRPARRVGRRESSHISGAETKKPKRSRCAVMRDGANPPFPNQERGRARPVAACLSGAHRAHVRVLVMEARRPAPCPRVHLRPNVGNRWV